VIYKHNIRTIYHSLNIYIDIQYISICRMIYDMILMIILLEYIIYRHINVIIRILDHISYIRIIIIMSTLIMCNILNVMCNSSSHYYPCYITMIYYLPSLCAIFLIFLISCAILPLTITITTLQLLPFNNMSNISHIMLTEYLTYIFVFRLTVHL